MKKLYFLFLALTISNDLYSEEIYLDCDIEKVIYSSSDSLDKKIDKEKISEILLIDLDPINKDITISPLSDKFEIPSVSTKEKIHVNSITNKSSDKIFHIIVSKSNKIFKDNEIKKYRIGLHQDEIKINRITGQIYSRTTYSLDGNEFNHIGNGNCKKFDAKKKKF
jgi:hypothetical protein